MYVEDLSSGYLLTKLSVELWDEDYGAMDYADHGILSDVVYDGGRHPLLIKGQRHRSMYIPVYPESSVPRDTVFVPGEGRAPQPEQERILVAKRAHALKLLRLMSHDPL